MKKPRTPILAACLWPALAFAGGPAVDAHAVRDPHPVQADDAGASAQMHQAMATMDRAMRAAPMTGDADRDFVAMMLPHHQGAIDMARALLPRTRDPELRNLAQSIIAGQQVEVALMQAWQQRHATAARPAPQGGSPR